MDTIDLPEPAAPPAVDVGGRVGLQGARRDVPARDVLDVLVERGELDPGIAQAAKERARGAGVRPELLLGEAVGAEALLRAMAEAHGIDFVDLDAFPIDRDAASLVPTPALRRYRAVPVAFLDGRRLLVAMADPGDAGAVDDLQVMTGFDVQRAVAAPDKVDELVEALAAGRAEFRTYDEEGLPLDLAGMPEMTVVPEEEDEGPKHKVEPQRDVPKPIQITRSDDDAQVIGLVQRLITEAADRGASDIHFEAHETRMRVRFRVDGVLAEAATIPAEMTPAVISRVKILSGLDIAERRLPQDGRVTIQLGTREIDLRTVTLPSAHGEGAVMRILDRSTVIVDLDALGMLPQAYERFTKAIGQSHGAVLVTGPTGSGKSTTLYGALNLLNTPEKHIITIEDPVEYQLEGVTQVQVNVKAGLSFNTGLRSMMRADPDIIMVGEIRDAETAKMAVESALTGHLVLSTLHTNDAPTAVTRLVEMGIAPYLVASSIDCVVAQRLARRLCDECKQPTLVPPDVLTANGFEHHTAAVEAFEPIGCPNCAGSGYKGRVGLYEVMWLTETIRRQTVAHDTADAIRRTAVEEGMLGLREDGLEKVRRGLTSIAEVVRVTGTR